MSLLGMYLRLRKWLLRAPVMLVYRLHFPRWKIMVGGQVSWKSYMAQLKADMRETHRTSRLQLAFKQWKEPGWRHTPSVTWLKAPENKRTPYICQECRALDDDAGTPSLFFQTVEAWSPIGIRSPVVYTALACRACGMLRMVDEPYVLTQYGPRAPHGRGGTSETYYLAYTVSYGPGYKRHRRQERSRKTHELIETRAESVSFSEWKAMPDLAAQLFEDVTIDRVPIDSLHVLYPILLKRMRSYEEERMRMEKEVD